MYIFRNIFLTFVLIGVVFTNLYAKDVSKTSNTYYMITIASLQKQDGIDKLKYEFKGEKIFIKIVDKFYKFSIINIDNFKEAKSKLKIIQKKYPGAYIQRYELIQKQKSSSELNSNSILKSRKLFF